MIFLYIPPVDEYLSAVFRNMFNIGRICVLNIVKV